MLNLQSKIHANKASTSALTPSDAFAGDNGRISIRDKLLVQEIYELEKTLKEVRSCQLDFPCSSIMHQFELTIRPMEGYYNGGCFKFAIDIPLEYNNVPPIVKCTTRIWHPNISEDGKICLSLLRQRSLDGYGWMPTRQIRDVVLGLNSLFTDLLDFDDPLNAESADQWRHDKSAFENRVRDYIRLFCVRNEKRE